MNEKKNLKRLFAGHLRTVAEGLALAAAGYRDLAAALAREADTPEDRAVRASRRVPHRVDDLELSVRTTNCLTRAGFETLGDVVDRPWVELRARNHSPGKGDR